MSNFVEIGQTVAEVWRFFIFHDGGRHHLGFFQFFEILTVGRLESLELRRRAKCGRNWYNRCRDMTIFRFSKILDLLWVCLDHPRRVFGGLYHCAKFGRNRCSSFDSIHVFRFREFGLKTPIHAPKIVLGIVPINGEEYQLNPKGHILAWVRVVWAIMREKFIDAYDL